MLLNTRENTCCFSGHRPSKLPWGSDENAPACTVLKTKLYDIVDALYAAGIRHFICGMAQGCDTYFAEQIIILRDEHPDITLEAAIPCESQAQRWTEMERNRYFDLISKCDKETLIQTEYTADCMIKRNRYMVDQSSVLVTVYDGTFGGTMQTINYAKANGLEIIEIRP